MEKQEQTSPTTCKLCELTRRDPNSRCPHRVFGAVEAQADGFYGILRHGHSDDHALISGPYATDGEAWAAVAAAEQKVGELINVMTAAGSPEAALRAALEMIKGAGPSKAPSPENVEAVAEAIKQAVRDAVAGSSFPFVGANLRRLPCGHVAVVVRSPSSEQVVGHFDDDDEAVATVHAAAALLGGQPANELRQMAPHDLVAMITGKGLAQA